MISNIAASTCPNCGFKTNLGINIGMDRQALVGDIVICTRCGEILELDEDLAIQPVSLKQLMKLTLEQHAALDLMKAQFKLNRQ